MWQALLFLLYLTYTICLMKKKIIVGLSLAIACISNTSFARGANEAWLTSGLSMPIGSFAATDIMGSSEPGFARPGAFVRLNYQHNFTGRLGATVFIQGSINPTDYTSLGKTNGSTIETNGNWKTIGFQVGPLYSIPLSPKLKIEARATVGMNQVNFGGFRQTTKDITRTGWNSWKIGSASTLALAYSAGIGAKFSLSKNLFIPVHIDFTGCRASLDNINTQVNELPVGAQEFKQNLHSLNFGIGIGYTF